MYLSQQRVQMRFTFAVYECVQAAVVVMNCPEHVCETSVGCRIETASVHDFRTRSHVNRRHVEQAYISDVDTEPSSQRRQCTVRIVNRVQLKSSEHALISNTLWTASQHDIVKICSVSLSSVEVTASAIRRVNISANSVPSSSVGIEKLLSTPYRYYVSPRTLS